ncbi:MAG: triose-phosphate isomerase [Candidatus Nealsonbacteria bacterium]|nr:triose-phosphate isomerase [Candidatus Nealsonbacteria bacterium]
MRKIIIANWKMNPSTLDQSLKLAKSIGFDSRVVICPPFPYLNQLKNLGVSIGAQDSFWEREGAFTGEVSPVMLKKIGCKYIIIGHSERRWVLSETNDIINKKIKACLAEGLKVIFCIGEKEEERKRGKEFDVLKSQIKEGLKGILIDDYSKIVIAYEPVWAIGTGNACSPDEAEEMRVFIKKMFGDLAVLYGGSVNALNAGDYIDKASFDGLLIGGASLKTVEFKSILKKIKL